jgi:hypothetical protein
VLAILCVRVPLPELEGLPTSKEAGRCGYGLNDRVPFLSRPIFCSYLCDVYVVIYFILPGYRLRIDDNLKTDNYDIYNY